MDIFDAVLDLEARFIEEGRTEGLEEGRRYSAVITSLKIKTQTGDCRRSWSRLWNRIWGWQRIGILPWLFRSLAVAVSKISWADIREVCPSAHHFLELTSSFRQMRTIGKLSTQIKDLVFDPSQPVMYSVESIRNKFKVLASQLGIENKMVALKPAQIDLSF